MVENKAQRITPLSEKILIQRKQQTGISKQKLVEYALLNMPYISKKDLKK